MAWTFVGAGSHFEPADSILHSSYVWNYPSGMAKGDIMVQSMARTQGTILPADWAVFHTGLPGATWSTATGSEPASFTTPVLDFLGNPASEDEYLTLITAWRWSPLQNVQAPVDPFDFTGVGYGYPSYPSGDQMDISSFITPGSNALIVVTGFHTNASPGNGSEPPLTYNPTEVGQGTVWDSTGARGLFHAGIEHATGGMSPVVAVTVPAGAAYDGWAPEAYANAVAPGDIPCMTSVV